MSRSRLLVVTTCILLAGCASPDVRPPEGPRLPVPGGMKQPPMSGPAQPRIRRAPPLLPPSPPAVTAPARRETVESLLRSGVAVSREGPVLHVRPRGAVTDEPLPLFRQAIVLTALRSELRNGTAAAPRVDIRDGVVVLAFSGGTAAEIAAAIDRAVTTPHVSRVRAVLPPGL